MRATTTEPPLPKTATNAARLAMFWFGIQAVWGAVLGISLQARCLDLAGSASVATYGRISILGALAAGIVQLLAGPASDVRRRIGERRIFFYVVGACGAAVSLFALYDATNVETLLLAYVALQATMNVAIGPYQAIVPDFVERDRIGAASGWIAIMQSTGNAVGAILASTIAQRLETAGALATILLGSALATVAPLRRRALQPLVAHERVVASRTLVDLFISRAFVYLGFYALLGYFYFYVNTFTLPAGLSVTTASGIGILLFTIVGALGAMLAARPADRLDERLVVTIGGGVLTLSIGALCVAHTLGAVMAFVAFAGIGWGIFLCADWALACRLLPPAALATTMAIWNIAVIGPQILAPLIATTILNVSGLIATVHAPRVAFMLAGAEVLIGVLWIWRLSRGSVGK